MIAEHSRSQLLRLWMPTLFDLRRQLIDDFDVILSLTPFAADEVHVVLHDVGVGSVNTSFAIDDDDRDA